MVRVKYQKDKNTGLMLTKPILTPVHGMVTVTLNPQTVSYHITQFDTNAVVHSGKENSLHKLKIAVKEQLKTFGVHFDDEVRHRRVTGDTQEETQLDEVANG